MSEHPSLLVLVIDVSPREWELRRRRIQEQSEVEAKLVDFEEMLRACMVFVNAYVLMHRHNQLCVIVNHPRQRCVPLACFSYTTVHLCLSENKMRCWHPARLSIRSLDSRLCQRATR